MFDKIRALFTRAPLKKSQLPLFDAPVRVEGHTRKDGTYVAPYQSKRKRAVKVPAHDKHPSATADVAKEAGKAEEKLKDSKTGTFAEYNARLKGDRDARASAIRSAMVDGAVRLVNPRYPHIKYLISPDAHQEGQYRRTSLTKDPDGSFSPSGHITHPSAEEAIKEAAAEGLVPENSASLADSGGFGAAYTAKAAERRADNQLARDILERKDNSEITDADRAVLARYSGNGGCGDSLNEFYTRPDVASAIWTVLGQLGGMPGHHVLEPSCGTGVFMHTAPAEISLTGVEMDPTSNRIATVLHQRHELAPPSPFETFAQADGRLFDGVVGNPPFGLRGALLAEDKSDIPRAEQYFLDTALDKTKTGGIVALVLPSGVMDASSGRAFRRRVMCKGQFLGAMRMPNTAFEHSQTNVTTDVVYFRRRAGDVANAMLTLKEDELKAAGLLDEEFVNGGYFDGRGSQNVMGTPEPGWRAKAGMGDDITVAGSMEGVAEGLTKFQPEPAVEVTLDQVMAAATGEMGRKRAARAALKSPYQVSRVGDVKLINGQAYVLQGDPPRWHATDQVPEGQAEPPHITSARGIGDKISRFVGGEQGLGSSEIIRDLESYIKEHGIPRKDAALRAAAQKDPALHRVLAAVDENGQFSDILTGRTSDAGQAGLEATGERLALQQGAFDVQDLGVDDPEAALDQLYASDKFALDGDRWTTMDQYLTGNLWEKLDKARAALASADGADKAKLSMQVQKLETTIDPKSLEDVELDINSAWVPLDVLQGYLDHKRARYLEKNPDAAQWMGAPSKITFEGAIYQLNGKDKTSFHGDEKLLLTYLNRLGVKADEVQAVNRINASFKRYVLASEHRARVEDLYNRAYRGYVQEKFSEEPMDVPGLTTERSLNKYHWPGLRWALARRKGIIAADVGLGKTPRALILAKLLKLHGHAKKPTIVVPKSVLANWLAEIDAWFPGSKVMVIGETVTKGKDGKLKGKADNEAQRNQKYHDLAQNEYDFVLMSDSAWNILDLSPIKKGEYANDDFWSKRGDSLGQAGDKKLKKMREAHDQALAAREFGNRSEVIYFDDLGIDAVLMDEAHCFPAGTLVDGVPIERLRAGHLVKSVDLDTGAVQLRPVTAVMKRRPDGLVRVHFDERPSVVCTPEHPFFVHGTGYVQARHLTDSCRIAAYDEMLPLPPKVQAEPESAHALARLADSAGCVLTRMPPRTPYEGDDQESASARALRDLQKADGSQQCAALEKGNAWGKAVLLLQELRRRVAAYEAGLSRGAVFTGGARGAASCLVGQRLAAHAGSDTAESGSEAHPRESITLWSAGSWWKRPAAAVDAALARCRIGLEDGVRGADQAHAQKRLSAVLQAGHCESGAQGLRGSGRRLSFEPKGARQGRKEDAPASGVRVARVEVLEPTGDGRFGGLCPDGFVYDIRVEGSHNYFAEGLLVHNSYKNLFSARNRFGQSPKFLGGSGESNRALDTNFKTKWIREQNGGKNVFMLTATPTKNSPLEVYSMLSHIAPEEFESRGIRNSEEFIDRFCEFKKDLALDVKGTVEDALITSGFKNMDEIRALMRKYIDRQTAAEVGLKLPTPDHQEHLIDMTAEQSAVYAELRELAAESAGKNQDGDSHIFSIMDKMTKAALDLELLGHAGAESPKFDAAVKTAMGYAKDGGQILFCESVESHEKLKKRFTEAGLKPDEIGIVNGSAAPSALDRQKISDDFNSGKLKVVIGNGVMEEGMNLQKQTSDIHHLDVPWTPATLQQRNGRGLRQGNTKLGVRIHRYLSKGSFDGYRYQTVAAKKDWQDSLWNGGDRLENLSAVPQLSREDMLIMLSADPEAARAKYADNKVVAMAAYEAGKRAEAGTAYHRFRKLHSSYEALPNKKSETAERLRMKLDEAHEKLSKDPHFDAKDALTNPNGVAVDAMTGRAFRPGSALHISFKDKSPFSWADGTHKFVVTSVDPRGAVSLRPYGQAGASVHVKTGDIASRAVDAQFDAKAEEVEAAANLLGNIAGRAAEEFSGHDKSAGPKVKEAVDKATAAVAAAEPAWHATTGGRAKMWKAVEEAVTTAGTFKGSSPIDDQVQGLVDTAELSLALREHGIAPDDVLKPEHLKGVSDAAITANLDVIHRRLNSKLLNYEASYASDTPVIGPDGAGKILGQYELRGELKTHKLMLPTDQDRRAALDAWKKEQLGRKFERKTKSSSRGYGNEYLPGVKAKYGDSYTDIGSGNPWKTADKLFGAGWTDEAKAELAAQAASTAESATKFSQKLEAWLPAVEVADYGGFARWPHGSIRDLAIAAKNEGHLNSKVADHVRVPQLFDTTSGMKTDALTTVGAALQNVAMSMNDEELARQIGAWNDAGNNQQRAA